MKKILILSTFSVLLLASSCVMHNKTIQGAPLEARVNFVSSDLDYVGEVTGTATQSYVFGLPFGGRRYYTASTGSSIINTQIVNRVYNNALYDALSSKADADFVLPISSESTTNRSFLGKTVTLKIRAKAFKIKTK